MTVFLVFEGGGSDDAFVGVFSTRELAQAFIDKSAGSRLFIHEAVVDSPIQA